jgi:hypothetical protein
MSGFQVLNDKKLKRKVRKNQPLNFLFICQPYSSLHRVLTTPPTSRRPSQHDHKPATSMPRNHIHSHLVFLLLLRVEHEL